MKIKQQQYQELLVRDQLNIEREEKKVFLDYGEFCAHRIGTCTVIKILLSLFLVICLIIGY